MTESEAFAALVAARRLHDPGAATRRDPRPLAIAAAEWLRAAGLDAAIGADALRDLDELLRAFEALADASVAPASRDRSPAAAARMQAVAWERIEEVAKRRGWK